LLVAALLALVSACDPEGPRRTTAGQNSKPSPLQPHSADRVYQVGRRLRDLPDKEDLSTPESADAAFWRAYVRGHSTRQLVIKSLPAPSAGKPLPAAYARRQLSEEILEVQIHGSNSAAVYRWHPGFWGAYFSASFLELHDGRWLRAGHHDSPGIQFARARFTNWCRYRDQEAARRAPVKNPERHLEPFVNLLRAEAEDPQAYVLRALAEHPLVIMGEVHHRPRYWAFNTALVQTAAFPRHVGVIYLELPSQDQALVDQFLANPQLDTQPVITMLRDMLWTGWPDQPTLDFFVAVWKASQSLPPQDKLRIVLVDPRALWKNVHARADAVRGEIYRDRKMANAILQDMRTHRNDSRHGLFVVGLVHALLDVTNCDGGPEMTAGRVLRQKLGANAVCAIQQHRPVRFSRSARLQRPALGLFDSAFAALDCRPMAFPLDHGPFGQVLLDEFLDIRLSSPSRYGDAFSAYLYLGPLEEEVFSPLIPGFYTDDFVREVDRRHRLLSSGKGLVESEGLARLDAGSFTAWMSQSWGQPRVAWSAARLGPLTRWQQGLSEGSQTP